MNVNSEMLALAREFRGLTQRELAAASNISREKIAKFESQLVTPTDLQADVLATTLRIPPQFLSNREPVLGIGSSAYFYRKKVAITSGQRRAFHSSVNVIRLGVKRLLAQVDVESHGQLPKLPLDEYGESPERVAQALRAFWQVPEGPIRNLTKLVERTGAVVIDCDFGRGLDATSMWLADSPPMIFMNRNVPGDRWRFTLAHELGHLVMHEIPHDRMEDEANAFAAEFLMPANLVRADFLRRGRLRLRDFAELKMYWLSSIQSLVFRARQLHYLSDVEAKKLWLEMTKLGYRSREGFGEPNPLPLEPTANLDRLLSLFADELNFSIDEVAAITNLYTPDFVKLFNAGPWQAESKNPRPALKLVNR
jgi:Zn-dependent peptidase ImmA (M78 family)